MTIDRHAIKVVAFGWFGTLMDELAGMQRSLTEYVEDRAQTDLTELAEAWQYEIQRFCLEDHYVPWPELAAKALERVSHGFDLPARAIDADQVRRWIRVWPFFDDQAALGVLGRRYTVAVISQLDSASLALCKPLLARTPELTVSSDHSRSYKPSRRYFELLRVQLKLEEPEELLIISAEAEIDLDPAKELGFQTLHVDRSGESEGPSDLKEAVSLLA